LLIQEHALAKINLNLHVTGRRDNGYHSLQSLVVFASVHDTIEVHAAQTVSLTITGPFAGGLSAGPENLVLKAAFALQTTTDCRLGATIHLQKNLPIASGIGGGSADAAATIKALCRLWQLSPPRHIIDKLALSLGADVPVCMAGTAQIMDGIGEQLTPAPLFPKIPAVLVNPGVPVSTPEVFQARKGDYSEPFIFTDKKLGFDQLVTTLKQTHNDLMTPALQLHPKINNVIDELYQFSGSVLARMSGSGATCFALFDTPTHAEKAAETLHKTRPEWWSTATTFNSNSLIH